MSTATASVSPIAALRQAEQSAVAQINRVADQVATLGTSTLDGAVARLNDEIANATARIRQGLASALGSVGMLTETLTDLVGADVFGLEEATVEQAPEPIVPTAIAQRMQSEPPTAREGVIDLANPPTATAANPPTATAADTAAQSETETPTGNMPHEGEAPVIDTPVAVPQVETEETTTEPSRNGRAKTARRKK